MPSRESRDVRRCEHSRYKPKRLGCHTRHAVNHEQRRLLRVLRTVRVQKPRMRGGSLWARPLVLSLAHRHRLTTNLPSHSSTSAKPTQFCRKKGAVSHASSRSWHWHLEGAAPSRTSARDGGSCSTSHFLTVNEAHGHVLELVRRHCMRQERK